MNEILIAAIIFGLWTIFSLVFIRQYKHYQTTSTANKKRHITISSKDVTEQQITEAHTQGKRVSLWGIYTEQDNIAAVHKNPDFIQTDKPIHLLNMFGRYKRAKEL